MPMPDSLARLIALDESNAHAEACERFYNLLLRPGAAAAAPASAKRHSLSSVSRMIPVATAANT